MEVEQGQIRLESQLNVLRDKNKEIVSSLKIPMPEVAGPTLLDNDFMRQFTFLTKQQQQAVGGRLNTMVNRNQGYQNDDQVRGKKEDELDLDFIEKELYNS